MLVEYLEWSTNHVSLDTTFDDWPASSSEAVLADDQSSFAAGEWPDVTFSLDSSTTRIVPASFLNDFMNNI